jgi:hypothetical protein
MLYFAHKPRLSKPCGKCSHSKLSSCSDKIQALKTSGALTSEQGGPYAILAYKTQTLKALWQVHCGMAVGAGSLVGASTAFGQQSRTKHALSDAQHFACTTSSAWLAACPKKDTMLCRHSIAQPVRLPLVFSMSP